MIKNLTIVGAQWGDEGKGKIVDYISNKFDIVLRFQGGHNAGHTIVIDNKKFILSVLPSGLIRNKLCIIGSNVVIDPINFFDEINILKKNKINISTKNLKVADNASILLPFHAIIDRAREKKLQNKKIGTTGRGIGPCYEDKVARRGIKICDLDDLNILKVRLRNLVNFHNVFLKNTSQKLISYKKTFSFLKSIRKRLLSYSIDLTEFINNKKILKKKFLFEGAQGLMLDNDYGTFPYVTSSNTIPANAASSIGVKVDKIGHILGIVKAYTTRVGEGPFPTEIKSELGAKLAKIGHEFGSVTNRPRRCGWFDCVQLKKAINIAGINSIALTKIDVLDTFKFIKVCYQYKIGNKIYKTLPNSISLLKKIKPQYLVLKGWEANTSNIYKYKDLPKETKSFISRLEKIIKKPISMISNGADRKNIIILKNL